MSIPDRWLNYKPIGKPIKGTRLIAFKVPLRSGVTSNVKDKNNRLDIKKLLELIPKLGLVIDLTNTRKYYDPRDFFKNDVQHLKLMIPGRIIPTDRTLEIFKNYIRTFLAKNEHNDKLIGVHCTHGVNRTGLLICHYMIKELKMDVKEAIKEFETARGHLIERKEYVNFLYDSSRKNYDNRVSNSPERSSTRTKKEYDNWRISPPISSRNNYQSKRESRESNVNSRIYSSFSSYSRKGSWNKMYSNDRLRQCSDEYSRYKRRDSPNSSKTSRRRDSSRDNYDRTSNNWRSKESPSNSKIRRVEKRNERYENWRDSHRSSR